jgi:hypothetical protein
MSFRFVRLYRVDMCRLNAADVVDSICVGEGNRALMGKKGFAENETLELNVRAKTMTPDC